MDHLLAAATKNVSDIITLAIQHTGEKKALIVTDVRSPLSRLMTQAYQAALPEATYIDFDAVTQDEVKAAINALSPGDLVVLAQSQDFRLNEFRLRIELFQRGLATIEHAHLDRETSNEQMTIFVEAMAYDPNYYRPLGRALKEKIDAAQKIEVKCAGTLLTYSGPMEPTKLNVGDYTGMKNVGGTFPIGEVFSEPQDIATVNGEAMIFGFAGPDHLMQIHEPFKIVIEKGMVVRHEGPAIFQQVLERISASESVMVREFGVGLNPAMGKTRVIPDVTSFERQKGLHFSLGEKHSVYKKAGLIAKKTHFHVDIFVDVETILVNGEAIYADGDVRVSV